MVEIFTDLYTLKLIFEFPDNRQYIISFNNLQICDTVADLPDHIIDEIDYQLNEANLYCNYNNLNSFKLTTEWTNEDR